MNSLNVLRITFYDKQAQRWNRENTLEVNENNVIFSKRMNIRSTNEVFKLTYAINLCTFFKKKSISNARKISGVRDLHKS